jgi:hypothetical protein
MRLITMASTGSARKCGCLPVMPSLDEENIMCKSVISLVILLLPLACFAETSDSFWGTYQGFSRACEASFLVLDKDIVSVDECKETSYTIIESDNEHILIEVKPSHGCRPQVIRIEHEKAEQKYGGYTVKEYKSRKDAQEDKYGSYCSYGKVDPSMAKDQTKKFLNGKTGEEREDALHKINLQGHQDRDKYNEIGLRDKSPIVRETSAFFLRGNPGHFVPMLISAMVEDRDAKVRASAGYSLSHFYTDNGSEGDLHIKPLEKNLDKLLRGLKNVETVRSVVDILGTRYTGNSYAPCFMSIKNREKVINALRNQLKIIKIQADAWMKGKASWSNELNEADHEIDRAIENLTKCHLSN